MTQSLAWVVRMLSELETNVVSVERVNEYSGIQTEKELESEKTPAKDWPTRGLSRSENNGHEHFNVCCLLLRFKVHNITFWSTKCLLHEENKRMCLVVMHFSHIFNDVVECGIQ